MSNSGMYNDEVFDNFVENGKLADKSTRKQVMEYVLAWELVLPRNSLVNLEILKIINNYISDRKITKMIKKVPDIKTELQYKLIELLEHNAPALNQYIADFNRQAELKYLLNKIKSIPTTGWEKACTEEGFVELEKKLDVIADDQDLISLNQKCLSEVQDYSFIYNEEQQLINRLKYGHLAKLQQYQQDIASGVSVTNFNTQTGFLPSIDPESKQLYELLFPELNELASVQDQDLEVDDQTDALALDEQYRQQFVSSKRNYIKNVYQARNHLVQNWQEYIAKGNLVQVLLDDIEEIDKYRSKYIQRLYQDIDEIAKNLELMEVFYDGDLSSLGRFWDLSKGQWVQSNGLDRLKEFAREIERNPEIKDIAQMLGRFQESEAEYNLENTTNEQKMNYFKINHAGKTELIGVTESNDLNHLLPTEIALLGTPVTEDVFYKKFVDKKLQTFEFISLDKETVSKTVDDQEEKEKKKEKGPFVIAVDTSGSMQGTPEYLAKMISFAVTKIAVQEKRKVFLISFSVRVEEQELTDIRNSLNALINFLSMSFNGGTDITSPVISAVAKMQTEDYEDGDFLLISDGIFPNVNYNLAQQVEELKKSGNKFYALMIGNCYNQNALGIFDNTWVYAPGQPLKDLVRIIKQDIFNNRDQNNNAN